MRNNSNDNPNLARRNSNFERLVSKYPKCLISRKKENPCQKEIVIILTLMSFICLKWIHLRVAINILIYLYIYIYTHTHILKMYESLFF